MLIFERQNEKRGLWKANEVDRGGKGTTRGTGDRGRKRSDKPLRRLHTGSYLPVLFCGGIIMDDV